MKNSQLLTVKLYLAAVIIMGVIVRQSTKYSILNYLGAAIGVLSTLFIYPLALESYGLVRWFIDIASLAAPFVMLGANALSIRFFPAFWTDKQKNKNALLPFLLNWTLVGVVLFSIAWWLFSGTIERFFLEQSMERFQYYRVLYPLTISLIATVLLGQFASNYNRIVIPSFLQDILIKISMPLLILGMVYLSWPKDILVYGVTANYIVAAICLLGYLYYLGAFRHLSYRTKLREIGLRSMGHYAIFGLFSSLGAFLALRIDRVMVGYMLGDTLNGIFSIVVTLGLFLEIPFRSVIKISAPIVAASSEAKDYEKVGELYKKSSLSLMLIGAVLFTGIWWLVDDVFAIMPGGDAVSVGKYVIFYYGLAVWLNMITSINGEIIGFSRFYRLNFYAYLFLGVLNVAMNWIFINAYGIAGASIATLISMLLFNALKSGFIWWKFRLQPFTVSSLLVVGLMAAVWAVLSLFNWSLAPILNMLVKGVLILGCFGAGVIWLNLSPELLSVLKNPLGTIFPGKK